MTLGEKISLTVAVLNILTLIVMTTALMIQGRTLRNSNRETKLALLGVRSQSLATLITYLNDRLSNLDPKDGLEVQNERIALQSEIQLQLKLLQTVLDQITDIEKGAWI